MEEDIREWTDDPHEIRERLVEAGVFPGSFSPEKWANLIVGRFREGAIGVLDDKK